MSQNQNPLRPEFPAHLLPFRELLPEILQILEEGRETSWYAFVWLEENRSISAMAGRMESTNQNHDLGVVYRIMAGGVKFKRHLSLEMASNFR